MAGSDVGSSAAGEEEVAEENDDASSTTEEEDAEEESMAVSEAETSIVGSGVQGPRVAAVRSGCGLKVGWETMWLAICCEWSSSAPTTQDETA